MKMDMRTDLKLRATVSQGFGVAIPPWCLPVPMFHVSRFTPQRPLAARPSHLKCPPANCSPMFTVTQFSLVNPLPNQFFFSSLSLGHPRFPKTRCTAVNTAVQFPPLYGEALFPLPHALWHPKSLAAGLAQRVGDLRAQSKRTERTHRCHFGSQ